MLTCASIVLGMHLATYHFNRESRNEEVNLGAYAICDDWIAGAYFNSDASSESYWVSPDGEQFQFQSDDDRHRRVAAYAGRIWEGALGPVDLMAGLAFGYRERAVTPMLVPSIKADKVPLLKSIVPGARLSFLPPLEKCGGGIHLSWEF